MKYEARCFTVDELRRILAAASNPWRVLYCILTMDGLRAGEAISDCLVGRYRPRQAAPEYQALCLVRKNQNREERIQRNPGPDP